MTTTDHPPVPDTLKTLAITLLLLLAATTTACVSSSSAPDTNNNTTTAPEVTTTHAKGKIMAPVALKLHLTRPQSALEVTAVLTLTAEQDLPAATARFVLPPGVTVKSGQLETKLGAMQKGQRKTLYLTLNITLDPHGIIAAGVDVQVTPGIKLHKGVNVSLGSKTAPPTSKVITMPDGTGARVGGVK